MKKMILTLIASIAFNGVFAHNKNNSSMVMLDAQLVANNIIAGQINFTLTVVNTGDQPLTAFYLFSPDGIIFDGMPPSYLFPGNTFTLNGSRASSGCADSGFVLLNATTLDGSETAGQSASSNEISNGQLPAPVITSVVTANCTTIPVTGNMQITLSGLPDENWTIRGTNSSNYSYSGSGTTAVLNIDATVIGSGMRFYYETASSNCPSATSSNYISRNKLHDFDNSAPMFGFYLDANQDGIVNVGDVINYQILIKNTAPCVLQNVGVNGFAPAYTNPNLSFSGDPNALVNVAGFSTYVLDATYFITAQDISNGYVYNATSVNPHWSDDLGGVTASYYTNCTTQLNVLSATENVFQNFKSYPNPVQNIWELSHDNTIDKVEITNLLGQTIRTELIQNSNAKIDLSGLSSGNYLAKVFAANQVKVIKIIKS